MANVKITDLAAYTNPDSTDVLPIVDVGADVTKKISIADLLENAGSGTAAAPGIAFDGDNNTGIYRPGADQLAISTNGTERVEFGTGEVVFNDGGENYDFRIEGDTEPNLVFIDASTNRVGLGTSSPSHLLTLNAPNANAMTLFVGDTTDHYSSIRGKYGAGNDFAQSEIRFINADNSNGRGALGFAAGSNSTTEHMRITYDGKVGIGTTSPDSALSVYGDTVDIVTGYFENNNAAGISAGNRRLRLGQGGTTASSVGIWQNAGIIESTGSGGGLAIGAYSNGNTDPIKFYTGSVRDERARIDGLGRLLVGTSSQSGGSLLQVNDDRIRIASSKTPASASDTGTAGEICWDSSYIYVCTATNTWKRAALSTW